MIAGRNERGFGVCYSHQNIAAALGIPITHLTNEPLEFFGSVCPLCSPTPKERDFEPPGCGCGGALTCVRHQAPRLLDIVSLKTIAAIVGA